jgi:hypothetical protein
VEWRNHNLYYFSICMERLDEFWNILVRIRGLRATVFSQKFMNNKQAEMLPAQKWRSVRRLLHYCPSFAWGTRNKCLNGCSCVSPSAHMFQLQILSTRIYIYISNVYWRDTIGGYSNFLLWESPTLNQALADQRGPRQLQCLLVRPPLATKYLRHASRQSQLGNIPCYIRAP